MLVEVEVDIDGILEDIDVDVLAEYLGDDYIYDYAVGNFDLVDADEEYEELKRKAELYDELMGGNDE